MKKIIHLVLALTLSVAGLTGQMINADAKTQTASWNVTYDGSKLNSSYDVDKATITSVMPGDTITYSVSYINNSSEATDFYLSADIINSLEDKNADGTSASGINGGAYSYKLSYTVDGVETSIYNSDTIGGDSEAIKGLNQAKTNLDNGKSLYFPVGTLKQGGSGTVNITIVLDGNSQDNDYMTKLASLDVKFGVEKAVTEPTTNVVNNTVTKSVVYTIPGGQQVVAIDEPRVPLAGGPVTGDSLIPIIVCTSTLVIGIILIGWYFIICKKQRKEEA